MAISRRKFLHSGVAAGTIAAATSKAPALIIRNEVKPVVIASDNGHQFKNGGTKTCVEAAFEMITKGSDVLDAVIAGVNIVELDPLDDSVGYGGLPNAEGVVQLDSCCMHGPKKRAGCVACLEGIRTPSLVARTVMDNTDHHLLVGKDAQKFARQFGFKIEDDLNTDNSRKLWLEWKRKIDPHHFPDPTKRAEMGMKVLKEMVAAGKLREGHVYGTIHCSGINAKAEICGVTTTSGLAFKVPGRVGDSPILGAGLYVDNDIGAAGSTGRGEANLYNLSSFFIVEQMRAGRHPKDACISALRRVKASTIEKRLKNRRGLPNFNLNFYAINKQGEYGSASFYPGKRSKFSLCNESGPKILDCEPLYDGSPEDA